MSFLRNFFRFPGKLLEIKKQMKRQTAFIHQELDPILVPFEQSNDGSLSEFDFKKIRNYYGVGSVVLAGEAIALLHDFEMKDQERKALTFLSAITGLYDDFFDKSYTDLSKIKDLSDPIIQLEGLNTHEQLFRNLLSIAIENIPQKEEAFEYAEMVFDAQENSLTQKEVNTSWEDLLNATQRKGSSSLLLYRCCFNRIIDNTEINLLQATGAFMQVCNDIFDVHKDLQEGIYTIANRCDSIDHLRKLVLEEFNEIVLQLEFAEFNNKEAFLDRIKFVSSQTLVALDHYEKATAQTQGKFQPEKYNSKEIVLAMDKPSNFMKAAVKWMKH